MTKDCYVSRVEREFNQGWAEAHPELFVERFFNFREENPNEQWRHSIDFSRPGYLVLIANKRAVPFDLDRDWLSETGRDN